MNLGEIISKTCKAFSNKIAIREDDVSISFKELDVLTNRVANGLIELGFQKGDRIALYMKNCYQYFIFRLACEKTGIVYIPMNRLLSKKDVLHILVDAEISGVVCDEENYQIVNISRSELPLLKWIITNDADQSVRDINQKLVSYRYIVNNFAEKPILSNVNWEDLTSINYTSGSTGKPKGVMLTQKSWLEVAKNMLIDRNIKSEERLLHIGPLTHASGSYFMPFFLRGSENIISSFGDVVEAFFHYVENYKITAFTCVPTMLIRIMDDPRIQQVDTSSLSMIGYGAAPMAKEQIKRAIDIFGPILVQNYGQTEAYMTVTNLTQEEHVIALKEQDERLASIGRPYTFVRVEVMDDHGRVVEDGEVGELVIQSDHVMKGYWKLPEETEKVFRNGWLLTGDLAKKDKDGFIYLLGRKKEMIISGGFNIYPREVEDVLHELPFVREAVVIGAESEEWGEKVVAFLVTDEERLPEIKAYCKEKLEFKKPKDYIIVQSLPKNPTGKVDKNKLKKLYQEKEGTRIG